MKYHVTFYYLASGMEGRADRRDYGIVEADSEKDAKCKAIGAQWPDADDATKSFVLSCLTAKPVASKTAPAGEREAYEAWKLSMKPYGFDGFDAYQAGAAHQRAQQPSAAPEVAATLFRALVDDFKSFAVIGDCPHDGGEFYRKEPLFLAATPQPSAGVVMPERKDHETYYDADEYRKDGWNACLDEFARLNGKEVGRG